MLDPARADGSGHSAVANFTQSPTLTTPAATLAGVILGTAAYMSPEQVRGKPVDKRADIWAFGVIVYEMVTGERLFKSEDIGEILAAVIKDKPPFDRVPASVRPLLQRCLVKDPRKRLRDIGVLLDADDMQDKSLPRFAGRRRSASHYVGTVERRRRRQYALWCNPRAVVRLVDTR
jgi:serine/threonine protein kinase